MLQKTAISVPLGAGVDTKTSDALIMPARLSRLENAVFTRPGELQKRPGAKALADTGWNKAVGDIAGSLAAFQDELILAAGGGLASYSARGQWYSKGTLRSAAVRSSGVYADQYQQSHPDCATVDGITLYAFESTAGGVYATVVDEATGARLVASVRVDADGSKPSVVACGKRLFIFYVYEKDPTHFSVRMTRIAVGQPTVFTAPAQVTADGTLFATLPIFAVKPFGGAMALAYLSATEDLVVSYVDPLGALSDLAGGYFNPVTLAGPWSDTSSLNLASVEAEGAPSYLYLLLGQSMQLVAGAFAQNLAVTRPFANVGAPQVRDIVNVTGARDTQGGLRCFFEVKPADGDPAYNTVVRQVHLPSDNSAAGAISDFCRSVGLATDAFAQDGAPMVGVVFDSDTQPTLFFLDSAGRVIAKALFWKAAGLTGWPRLPNVNPTGAGRWLCAVGSRGRFVSEAGQITYSLKAVSRVVLDFRGERYRSVQLGKNLHLGGGAVMAYDGAAVFEHGFHVYPDRPTGQCGLFGLQIQTYGQASKRQEWYVIPPDDDRSVQPVVHAGARIRPGQYLIFYDSETVVTGRRLVVWFEVDGQGGAPGFGNACKVAVKGGDTQQDVCRKMAEALQVRLLDVAAHPSMGGVAVELGAGWAVKMTSEGTTGPFCMPVGDTDMGYGVMQAGTALQPEKTRLTFPAAKWISSGQWFQVQSSYADMAAFPTGPIGPVLAYFVVDGVAPAEVPSAPGAAAVPVPINSTDDWHAVALAVQTVLNGVRVGAGGADATLWTSTLDGPTLELTCRQSSDGSYGAIPLTQYQGRTRINDVGGGMGSGTRQYFACYSWTDAQGQYHRSAPSLPFTATVQARDFAGAPTVPDSPGPLAPGNDQQTHATCIVSVPTLRITRRNPVSVQVELYRTVANQQIPYLVATKPNSAAVDAVSFTDATKDSDLLNAVPLYTAGGELENVPPPGSTVIATHRQRLFALDPDDPDLVWPSKEAVPGYAAEFNDELAFRVDAAGGEITAIWPQDDRTLIFKRRRILGMAGNGPDANGRNSTWTPAEIINTDVGCVSADSLVFSPVGTFFKSEKGIYLLSRALEVRYVGAPVDAYNDLEITSAVLMPGVTQVRFTTSGGPTLVYDYALDQWSIFTYGAVGAVLWQGLYHRLLVDGRVMQETPGAFVDEGGPVRLLARTSWLKLADVQGYGRVYKALLLGRYLSKHRLQVGLAYDYDQATSEQLVFDAGAALGGNAYGNGGAYGADPIYGGSAVEQLDIRPSIQKCEALQLEFSDLPDDAGASLALVHLQLVVGVKGPGFKRASPVNAGGGA